MEEEEEQRIRVEKAAMASLITKLKQQIAVCNEETRSLCDACGGAHHQGEDIPHREQQSTWTRNDEKELELLRIKSVIDVVLSTEPHQKITTRRGNKPLITFPTTPQMNLPGEASADKETAMTELD